MEFRIIKNIYREMLALAVVTLIFLGTAMASTPMVYETSAILSPAPLPSGRFSTGLALDDETALISSPYTANGGNIIMRHINKFCCL